MPPRQQQPAASGPPRRLTPRQRACFLLAVPVGLLVFTAGLLGLIIIWDDQRAYALSRTPFADLWRRAVQHNPFVQAFSLNFGGIGLIYSIARLVEHLRAAQQADAPATRASQRQQQQRAAAEGRKDK